jgi:hypothetical protein
MRRAIAALLLSVTLIGTVAACKSSSSSTAAGGSTKAATTGGAAAAGGSSDDAHLSASTDICTLLPPATVKQVTGVAFDTGKPQNTPGYELFGCEYTSTSKLGAEMVVDVTGKDGSIGYSADLSAYQSVKNSTSTISGLGDKAFSITIAGGAVGQIDALFGPELITVNGLSTLTDAQATQLINRLHSALA